MSDDLGSIVRITHHRIDVIHDTTMGPMVAVVLFTQDVGEPYIEFGFGPDLALEIGKELLSSADRIAPHLVSTEKEILETLKRIEEKLDSGDVPA